MTRRIQESNSDDGGERGTSTRNFNCNVLEGTRTGIPRRTNTIRPVHSCCQLLSRKSDVTVRGRRGNWLPRCLYAFHRRIPTTGGSFYRAVLAPPSWRTTNKEPVTYIQFPLLLAPTALFVQGNRFLSLLEKHHYHWSSFLLHI